MWTVLNWKMGQGDAMGICPQDLCGEKRVSNISRLEAWDLGIQIFVSAPSHSCYSSRLPMIINNLCSLVYMYSIYILQNPDCLFFSAG